MKPKKTKLDLLKTFKLRTEKSKNQAALDKYIGRTIKTMDGLLVKIERIVPSFAKPTRYEINGNHHVVMLDFYKQVNNDKSITQEQIDAFDAIEFEVKRKDNKPHSLIDRVTH